MRKVNLYLFLVVLPLLFFAVPEPTFAEISQSEKEVTYKQLELFSNILSILQEHYVEEINTKEALNGAIRGLLFSLDPHSSYLPPESYRDLQDETRGSFTGIGIEVTIKNELLTIVSPIAETPADQAGLKANDIILEIDGKKTKNMGPYEAIEKLRGLAGTSVSLSIHREGWDEPKKMTIKREIIPIQSVKAEFLSPGYVYSRITKFQHHTGNEFKAALQALKSKGQIDGLILDLRNNPGGLLQQAVSVADLFLEKGKIVYTKGRKADQNTVYNAHGGGEKRNYPLVILVNEGSASAAEIVAGAIQAHKRGIIVGTQSFGKGTVQTVIPLPDGAGLRMTTALYYTPDDRSIQAKGIKPDVEVPFVPFLSPDRETSEKTAKKSVKEADLANHLPDRKEAMATPDNNSANLEDKLQKDNQLRTAYNILKSLNLYSEHNKTDQ
jgi:carboxyl-terminal processing protease